MRLSTIDSKLSTIFLNVSNLSEAKELYEIVFWHCYTVLNKNIRQELEEEAAFSCLKYQKLPLSDFLDKLCETFDKRYFELEEKGEIEASDKYFKKARIAASVAQANRAENNKDYAEAAYEALMTSSDPKAQAASIVFYLIA